MKLFIIGLCGQSVFLRVPHFHAPGETLHAMSLFSEPGGKGYNQAVAARRMGAEVVFAGAVGRDAEGDLCEARLAEEGIASCLIRKPERTAYASILTDIRGLEDRFAEAGMVLLTPEIPEEVFAEAIALAKKHGVRVAINPAPFFPWVRKYLDSAWLLTPNGSEARAMFDCGSEWLPGGLPGALAASRYPRVIVTLGGEGALVAEDGVITKIPAPSVTVRDTTGAGDCFNGVLCAWLLEGYSLTEAAGKAVLAASLSVAHPHVLDGMPRREEIG